MNDMVEQGEIDEEELSGLQKILDRAEKQKKKHERGTKSFRLASVYRYRLLQTRFSEGGYPPMRSMTVFNFLLEATVIGSVIICW